MKINNIVFILLVLFLCHTSGMAQVVHQDSITKKHTGYYTIDVGENWSAYGYLKKGKKEGFWIRSRSDKFGPSFILDYYKHNKRKTIAVTNFDSVYNRSFVPDILYRKSFNFVFENGKIQEVHYKRKDFHFKNGLLYSITIRNKKIGGCNKIVKYYNSNREIDSILRYKIVYESNDEGLQVRWISKNGRQRYYNNEGKLISVEIIRNREFKRMIEE